MLKSLFFFKKEIKWKPFLYLWTSLNFRVQWNELVVHADQCWVSIFHLFSKLTTVYILPPDFFLKNVISLVRKLTPIILNTEVITVGHIFHWRGSCHPFSCSAWNPFLILNYLFCTLWRRQTLYLTREPKNKGSACGLVSFSICWDKIPGMNNLKKKRDILVQGFQLADSIADIMAGDTCRKVAHLVAARKQRAEPERKGLEANPTLHRCISVTPLILPAPPSHNTIQLMNLSVDESTF